MAMDVWRVIESNVLYSIGEETDSGYSRTTTTDTNPSLACLGVERE